jgi:hypothetical protein
MDVVPPPDVATAGDLSSAENLALLAVHDCNALQKELQADALTGIPEDGVRELLISALTAEADVGLLRCACLHRWEVLGAPSQADEKVATLNDLLDGCAIASATLRSYTNRRVTFISRQRHDHSTDDPGRQSPLWDYGYVDDGRVVWMFRDVFPDEIAKALQKVEAQITSLRQAHFLDDPDVQAVQKLEHTLQAQARPHNWIAQKLPNAGSVYNTPNQRRMAARGRFAIAASVNSRMAPQGVPEVKIP